MPTDTQTTTVILAAGTTTACAACGHDVARHDAISSRYCQATTAGAVTRDCICAGQ